MYRKRRNPYSHFRTPNPYGPITGEQHALRASRPLCRFTLDAELTTSTEFVNATLTDQYGAGIPHSYSDTIVLQNTETETDGTYMFEGAVDDAGLAIWHSSRLWIIVKMDEGTDTYKPWCSFSLDSALDTTDEWIRGELLEQYGEGKDHTEVDIVLHNMETHDGSYEFYGDAGDMGYAFFDRYEEDTAGTYGTAGATVAHWRINPIECP